MKFQSLFGETQIMKRLAAVLVAAMFSIICTVVHADYSVWDKGMWPETWPKELESLRKQSRTFEGPVLLERRYLIPFTKREEFENAWPQLLKVKTKGAPIILVRGPKMGFFEVKPAGVLVKSPPEQTDKLRNPEIPIPGLMDVRTKWRNTTFIELIVDGEIVDLNRIPIPPDTPIIDERFKDRKN
jgi:hypothetical protein